MPLVVDQINDMIKAGVPVPEINKFKENKILEMLVLLNWNIA